MQVIHADRQNKLVKRILDWRESLATLPDNYFFGLVRMYLGEVKTPYNKQKLLEELGSFLRKEENRQTLVQLLSDDDLQLISAVFLIPDATQEKLTDFFSGTISFATLYERLINLEERLILYRCRSSESRKMTILINPLLEDSLKPLVGINRLLPAPVYAERISEYSPLLTPLLIASFLSYIAETPDICKTDGSFRKRSCVLLEKTFPGRKAILQILITAFENLSLVKIRGNGFFVDYQRCSVFARMSEQAQYAYLCVGSCGRFSREGFRSQAQLLLDSVASIPDAGFTRPVLARLGMLVKSRKEDSDPDIATPVHGRFSQILEQYRTPDPESGDESVFPCDALDRFLDSAIELGIVRIGGKTPDGQNIFTAASLFKPSSVIKEPDINPVLSIDAGFTITMMPGASLSALLPVVRFMNIVRYDTVSEFEISRKSVIRAFDSGVTPDQILDLLTAYTQYAVPQNLKINIEEWYYSYSSAVLYSGFVLKIDESNTLLTERNPVLAPHIKTVLAPGVYLLDITDEEAASALIASCGLDFIGRVRTVKGNAPVTSFPGLKQGESLFSDSFEPEKEADRYVYENEQKNETFFSMMSEKLKAMNLDEEQEQGLASRIKRKIVLNVSQLRPDSVRAEKNEASGMDFMGKVRIIERAIATNSMIELGINKEGTSGSVLGIPVAIEKQTGDAVIRLRIEPSKAEEPFSVGRARFVKRISGSVFDEIPGQE